MPNPITTLFTRATAYLTPATSSDSLPQQAAEHANNFTKAPTPSSLFPEVDPSIDGEECDKDCGSCSIKYPWTFRIDETDELYGQINGWATHILVATGRTDWVKDVTNEKGSVMEAVGKFGPGGITSGVSISFDQSRGGGIIIIKNFFFIFFLLILSDDLIFFS